MGINVSGMEFVDAKYFRTSKLNTLAMPGREQANRAALAKEYATPTVSARITRVYSLSIPVWRV